MATKARLHWFWRGVIAVAAGTAVFAAIAMTAAAHRGFDQVCGILASLGFSKVPEEAVGMAVVLGVPSLASAVTMYGILVRRFAWVGDGELHCRACDHILRGLSEPRCPECGEAI